MLEINRTFMYNGIEYKINYINEKKQRFGLEQIGEKRKVHETNQIIKIDDTTFKITYVHAGKNRISIEPIRG